jgi:hypothetical protein
VSVTWNDDLTQRAQAFHEANPHVFAKLLEIARDLRGRGIQKAGIALLFERLRWLSTVRTEGDRYALNNSYRAWYARELMAQAPDLAGLFDVRESATDPEYHAPLQPGTPGFLASLPTAPVDTPPADPHRLF